MDAIDRKLLCLLAQDADVTASALAPQLNLSVPAINKRIARLKSTGAIRRTTILTDGKEVGKPITAYVLVALDRFSDSDKFLGIVAADRDILECSAVTGAYDYILKICAADIDALEDKLLGMKKKGIAKTDTLLALREYKNMPVPLPDPERDAQ